MPGQGCGVLLTRPRCPRSPPGPALLQSPLRLRARERRRAGLQGGRHHHPDEPDRRELVRGDDPRPVRLLPAQLRGSAGPATSVKGAAPAPSVPSSIPAPAPPSPRHLGARRHQGTNQKGPTAPSPREFGYFLFFFFPFWSFWCLNFGTSRAPAPSLPVPVFPLGPAPGRARGESRDCPGTRGPGAGQPLLPPQRCPPLSHGGVGGGQLRHSNTKIPPNTKAALQGRC